jgi:hypothetical protein
VSIYLIYDDPDKGKAYRTAHVTLDESDSSFPGPRLLPHLYDQEPLEGFDEQEQDEETEEQEPSEAEQQRVVARQETVGAG